MCLCLCFAVFMVVFSAAGGWLSAAAGENATAGEAAGDEEKTVLSVDPTRHDQGYSAVLYDNENGLPTSEANAIAQTPEGFIWIGSYSGLIRYDGNTFVRMDSTNGIASVVSLFVDSKGRLWVGTNDAGVAVIDKGEIRMFRTQDGLKALSVRAITEDPNGYIYVATTRGIVEINDSMNVRTLEQKLIRDEYIRDLQCSADGVIYGLTQEGALFTLKEGMLDCFYNFPEMGVGLENIVSLCSDPENPGYVYLGTNTSAVIHMDLNTSSLQYTKTSTGNLSHINSIDVRPGQLWICADNGIAVMEGDSVQLLSKVPMNNSVDHMLTDYQGNLWFTSSRQGVMKIVANSFADVYEWYGLEPEVVNTTCEYHGCIFIGTDTGLTILDNEKVKERWIVTEAATAGGTLIETGNLVTLLRGVRIRSIIADDHDRLWLSTYGKYSLVCLERHKVVCYTVEDGLPGNRVRTVHECSDGSILVACTGGAALIRGGRIVRTFTEKDGLRNTEILTVEEAPNGDYILGTDGGGIYIFRSAGTPKERNVETGLSSDVVMRVKKDRLRDIYWIVTSNALAFMDVNYQITVVKDFPYSNNFDVYQNSKDEIWVLSSNGIYVVPATALLTGQNIDPVFYSRDNGLPVVPTANSYSALTKKGDLYIAGNTGVALVNIESPVARADDQHLDNLKMAVPYVLADGVAVYPDEDGTIRIPSRVRKVEIQCFVFTYSLENPQVSYWLEGFDNTRISVKRSDLGPVSFTNLSGGTYYFNMLVHDALTSQNQTYRIRIVKYRAVYEMWWFKLLAVLAGLLLAGAVGYHIFRQKMKRLIAKEEEQRTFINEMTEAFAKTIDMKDSYTNGHSFRVAQYTTILAKELGYSDEDIEKYHNIALLHDIGKIGVDDKVLKKEGKLEDDEFKQIKSHASRGYEVLKDISIMPELAIGAGAHHERPDGKGYPKGLKGDEIPRVAQIIAVADTFDAMYSDRPYRRRMNFDKAVSIIRDAAGTQLTADVVDAFLRLVEKGYFRAPDDEGGGTTEDIDNVHKSFSRAQEIKAEYAERIANSSENVKKS